MRDRLIPPLVTLTAGAITCIVDIYHKAELIPLKAAIISPYYFLYYWPYCKGYYSKDFAAKIKNDD